LNKRDPFHASRRLLDATRIILQPIVGTAKESGLHPGAASDKSLFDTVAAGALVAYRTRLLRPPPAAFVDGGWGSSRVAILDSTTGRLATRCRD